MIRKILTLACALLLLAAVPLYAMAEGAVQLTVLGGDFGMLESDRMKARFTVNNPSADQTVTAFEMRVYAMDEKGRRIWGEDTYYYWTTKKEIGPGETACSDDITLPDCSRVAQLYAAISKVTCTDGTVAETNDADLAYSQWAVRWN